MSQVIEVSITSKDKTKAGVDSAKINLDSLGSKVSGIGLRMSAAFTVPLVGLATLIAKNEELKESLVPVQEAFKGVVDELALSIIPVIKDLTPTLISLAGSLGTVVGWFSNLTVEQKEAVLAVLVVIGAIGPLITIVGQLIGFIGSLQAVWGVLAGFLSGPAVTGALAGVGTALAGVGAAIVGFLGAITLPVWLLIGAIVALVAVIILWGDEAWANAVRIEQTWLALLGALPGFIGGVFNDVGKAISDWFTQAGLDVSEFFISAKDTVGDAIDQMKNADWGGIGRAVIDKIGASISAGATWIADTARRVAQDAVNSAISLFGMAGTGGSSIPALQGRAYGGFVMPGTPYVVGERGVPEVFVPAGGGNIVPMSSSRSGFSAPVQFVYAPVFSMADQNEFEDRLKPFIQSVLRGG